MSMNFLPERDVFRLLRSLLKTETVAPGDLKPGDVIVDDDWHALCMVATVEPCKQTNQHGVEHDAFMVLDSFDSGGSYLPDQYKKIIARDSLEREVIDNILEDQARDMAINTEARKRRP